MNIIRNWTIFTGKSIQRTNGDRINFLIISICDILNHVLKESFDAGIVQIEGLAMNLCPLGKLLDLDLVWTHLHDHFLKCVFDCGLRLLYAQVNILWFLHVTFLFDNVHFLKTETVSIPAVLNDSVAAKDFQRGLPVTVSGSRGKYDYHFKTAIGCFDPEQTQIGWQDGDISLSGGWLRVFFSGGDRNRIL